jgi:hypothetical protein
MRELAFGLGEVSFVGTRPALKDALVLPGLSPLVTSLPLRP